jgi:hypothetical protein
MPQTVAQSVENNFTKGLITESTGLNFPENAATSTDNCTYTLIGDVTRRQGIDVEFNATYVPINSRNKAYNSYKWNNAGGDGNTQVVVVQTGTDLQFFRSSTSTPSTGIARQILTTLSILPYATGVTPDPGISECQFADGNGYLFVYHPNCDPFFCTYSNGGITLNRITVNIRDFSGTNESVAVNLRPTSLTNDHLYNLTNQGWTSGSPWLAHTLTSWIIQRGMAITLTVESGLAVTLGDIVGLYNNTGPVFPNFIPQGTQLAGGNVTAYSGTSMTILVTGITDAYTGQSVSSSYISPYNHGFIDTWKTAIGNYPSNADVWWYFKDSANAFNPAITSGTVTFNSGPAPKGHYILNAFVQNRSVSSGISGLTTITTSNRPRTGTWFQGRVWYTGVDGSQIASGDANFYTWTENIYFSQVVTDPSQFGQCYQTNDPTAETLFGLLPTDGGIINIPGSGSIYKLFSLQNALLVFAANGIWYITGSQGIGFAANDYTIVKLSAVSCISSTSFVDVNGMPYFWNEEGIYAVEPAKQGTSLLSSPLHVNPLEVVPLTIGTILTFYNSIPPESKRYARGAYHPLDYVIQWTFRSTSDGDSVAQRYQYDRILNFNTSNKAFYPYTVTGTPKINGIIYVSYPPTSTTPEPSFKYITTVNNTLTFSDEHDTSYVDWFSFDNVGTNYDSFFITGYKLRGKAIMKFQPQYIQVFSKTNGAASGYQIQGIWNYANDPNSGKYSVKQRIINALTRFDVVFRRHKIRGHGYTLQFKIDSIDGMPFDILGWAIVDTVNQGT